MAISSVTNTYTSGTSGSVQYTGLTSDVDWTALVDSLVQAESHTVTQLTNWKTEWSNKITSIQGLDSRLLILETQAGDISTATDFYSRSASSSNGQVATVTATSTATPGAHTVTVGQNIPQKLASQGWVDLDTTPLGDGGGDFVLSIGTVGTISIAGTDITATTTLQDLCNLINSDPENTGSKAVSASIINDGSTSNPFRLVISPESGGPDYCVSVLKNPFSLNFYNNDISCPDSSTLTAATTTPITTMGSFTADKSTVGSLGYRTYTFTGPAAQETVGIGDWTISWVGDSGGGSGTISLGASYTAGDTIELEDGVFITFGEGTFEGGNTTFTLKAYSNDIGDVEFGTWTGTSTISSDGNYQGSTSKTFSYEIAGTGTKTIGTDSFQVAWSDSEGNSGTIEVTADSYTDLSVSQGVKLSFEAGTVLGGDTFSTDVYHSTLQAGVSEGLAKAEVETHSGFVDENNTAVTDAEGTFSYTYGGVTRTITVPAGSTLSALRDLINNDDDNPGITAAIINDGSGLSTAYHLQLVGKDTGVEHSITTVRHTLDNFAKGGTTGFGFSETQSAQNAMLKVDGYPRAAYDYLQRNTNIIGDLISGVSLSLTGAGTSTISISNDKAAIREKIHSFLDSINDVLSYITQQTAYDAAGKGENNGVMIGNYGFEIVQQRIKNILSSSVPGLAEGVDSYTTLSQIGIHSDPNQNGKWVVDALILESSLNNDMEGVGRLFVKSETSTVVGIAKLIETEADNLTKAYTDANPGIVSVLIQNYQDIISNIDKKIDNENRRLQIVRDRLNTKFSNLEIALGQMQGQKQYLTNLINALTQKK